MKNKEKLSITLSPELIEDIDEISKTRGVRSRSEMIEKILREIVDKKKISKAVLVWKTHHIVGGAPTILIKAGNKTSLEFAVDRLARLGITEILIAVEGYMKEIFSVLGDGSKYGVRISYAPASRHLGNAGIIKSNQQFFEGSQFLVLSADIYFDFKIEDLIKQHAAGDSIATLSLVTVPDPQKFGEAVLHKDKIVQFAYKSRELKSHLIMAGISVFSPEIFSYLPHHGDLETEVFSKLAAEGKLGGFLFKGTWIHLHDREQVENLKKHLKE